VTHSHPPETPWLLHFHGDHNDALAGPSARPSAVIDAAGEHLVHLDITVQGLASGPHHGDPVSMQHRPGHPIAGTKCA